MDTFLVYLFLVVWTQQYATIDAEWDADGNMTTACNGAPIYMKVNSQLNLMTINDDFYPHGWYNATIAYGYKLIAWKDDLPSLFTYYYHAHLSGIALKEKHINLSMITDVPQLLPACVLSNNVCEENVDIWVQKCDTDLFYYMANINQSASRPSIYTDLYLPNPCSQPVEDIYIENINDLFLIGRVPNYKGGWYSAFYNNQHYFVRSLSDIEEFYRNGDYGSIFKHRSFAVYTIQDTHDVLQTIGTKTRRTPVCYIGGTQFFYSPYMNDCVIQVDIYLSKCGNKLRFYYSEDYGSISIVLYAYNRLKAVVKPALVHTTETITSNGQAVITYSPSLQFRCEFDINITNSYSVNWYVDGSLVKTFGPSNNAEEFVFGENDFEFPGLNCEIQCGVSVISDGETSNETLGYAYYAGIKVTDKSIDVSKIGFALVEAQITVPIGCEHRSDDLSSSCDVNFILLDPHRIRSVCGGGLQITNLDGTSCTEKIETLRQGEIWDYEKKYRFNITTIEDTFDDKTEYNLLLKLPADLKHTIWSNYTVDDIQVTVTDKSNTDSAYKNKICYSHIDPHMNTADGRPYEQHRKGDFWAYVNRANNIQIQEFTKFCFDNGRPPVCACGIAIIAGADVYLLHRCGNITVNEFTHCGDGGIIDVEMVNGYRYKITLPTGTKVTVTLHTERYMDTMNIDILLSAKDLEHIGGLCGYFDDNKANDFIRKDGSMSSDNFDYKFSESWRLKDEENVVLNLDTITLKRWSQQNRVSCFCDATDDVCGEIKGQNCHKATPITLKKCRVQQFKKRDSSGRIHTEELKRLKRSMLTPPQQTRQRRSVQDEIDNTRATDICSTYLNVSQAFIEFPDKLAGETLNEVMKQCVFDVMAGNDPSLALIHKYAVDVIAQTIMDMNPVYTADNSELVTSFLRTTCLNNCTGSNGICMDDGQCLCIGDFKGPDCTIDIHIAPSILDIEGGGLCDISVDEGLCFIIRVDNIFEGFSIRIVEIRLYFNGSVTVDGSSEVEGLYEDLFTGMLCIPEGRKKRSVSTKEDVDFIIVYNVSISNDNEVYSDQQTIYIYDSLCQTINVNGGNATVTIKNGYCFIEGVCIPDRTTDGCKMCIPETTVFDWSYDNCDDADDDDGLPRTVIIGIVAGLTCMGLILISLIGYKMYRSSVAKKNRVGNQDAMDRYCIGADMEFEYKPSVYDNYNVNDTNSAEKKL